MIWKTFIMAYFKKIKDYSLLFVFLLCGSLFFNQYCFSIGKGSVRKEFHVGENFSLKFSGNVSLECFYDSRQVFGVYHDEYILYPLPIKMGKRGLDINSKDQLSMTGIYVNCKAIVSGPKVWGAESSAIFKADFVGSGDDDLVRLLRIKQGYSKLEWGKTDLILGFDYHPLFMVGVMAPETLSNAQGISYNPFAYVAQARALHRFKHFDMILALIKHQNRPAARLAVTPDLFFQLNAKVKSHLVGAGVNYHIRVPRMITDEGFRATNEQLGSAYPFIFGKFKLNNFEIRGKIIYSENGSIYFIMGTYATKFRNVDTDDRSLVNLRAISFWSEFIYRNEKVEPGLFVGYTKNLGASCDIIKSYEDEQGNEVNLLEFDNHEVTNARYMFIAAPRIKFRFGPVMVGAELEYFRVGYANRGFDQEGWQNDFDSRGNVICYKPVSNTRILISTYYYF